MKVVSGKELYESFGKMHEVTAKLQRIHLRLKLPDWKRHVIDICERIIARMEKQS